MKPINILIGANGAGKSNFVSLFTFLRHLSQGRLQTYIEKNGFANTFFHFGSKATKSIKIGIDVGQNGYYVEFVRGEANDALVFETEYCTFLGSDKLFTVKGVLGESGLLPDGEARSAHVKNYTRKYMENCRVYHFHDTSPRASFKQDQSVDSNYALLPDAANLAPFLAYLKEHWIENYHEIVRAVRTVVPFFHDFYFDPRGESGVESLLLRWTHSDHDTPFSANQLSDGTARFICMAALFLQPQKLRPDTIVIDEPELGLHPAALEVLAEIIKYVSQDTQIVCSTQSVTFANQFEPNDFIVVGQENGVSRFSRLKEDELQVWLENYRVGDIWAKNLIGGRP